MNAALETLLGTLLYEGYALYPYTSSATKNATPTPFGIVYPPAYAEERRSAFDHLGLRCVARGEGGALIEAEVRFLQAAPEGGHRAVERRLAIPARPLGELAAAAHSESFVFDGLSGRLHLSARPLAPGITRVALFLHNTTTCAPGADRAEALRHSLLSTHPFLTLSGGTFASPLERDGDLGRAVERCACVNTYPVLATPEDDVLLGATIALPDHPRLAPESGGDLFDATEIEEALVLHLLALSDEERAQVGREDPRIRGLLARVAGTTPADLMRLHGRTVISDAAVFDPAVFDPAVFDPAVVNPVGPRPVNPEPREAA